MKNPLFRSTYGVADQLRSLARFIRNGILPGGFSRTYQFLRTFPLTNPSMIPLVVQDWTIGISMRNYVDRHFVRVTEEEGSLARNHFETLEKTFHRYLSVGHIELSLDGVRNAAHNLSISIKGMPGVEFFEHMGIHLEHMLKTTSSSVTLRIEDLHEAERHNLHRLIARLSRYGDRIYIAVSEKLRDKVQIDSSVFNLMLES